MQFEIRPYQESDLAGLLSAWDHASQIAHDFLSEEFQAQVRRDIPALYLPNAETWIADADGQVAGFISLLGEEIGAVFVHPVWQNQGAGRALVDKARAIRPALEVEVFERNAIGRRFYAAYGFLPTGQSVHEETGNVLLRLRLGGAA